MIVREAKLSDVQMIAQVHIDTWRTTYREIMPEDYLAKLSYQKREIAWRQVLSTGGDSDQFVYVAEEDSGQIVGFASGGKERTGDPVYKGELFAIYVLDVYQQKGVGHRLTLSVGDRLSQLGFHSMLVWVLADNSACKFYEAIGGQKVYEKQTERGGIILNEVAYGWTDVRELTT